MNARLHKTFMFNRGRCGIDILIEYYVRLIADRNKEIEKAKSKKKRFCGIKYNI